MLPSHDVAVIPRPQVTSASYSSTYDCTPDSIHTDASHASTAFDTYQASSQYISIARLALNPVNFYSPNRRPSCESQASLLFAGNYFETCFKICTSPAFVGGKPHLAVLCRDRCNLIDGLFISSLNICHTSLLQCPFSCSSCTSCSEEHVLILVHGTSPCLLPIISNVQNLPIYM